jgi:hypothetical protein
MIALELETGGLYPKSGSGVTLPKFLQSSSASLEPRVISICTSWSRVTIVAGYRESETDDSQVVRVRVRRN